MGRMHVGRLDGRGKLSQLYSFLLAHQGEWFDGWDLTTRFRITAVATWISGIREHPDRPPGVAVEHKTTHENGTRGEWYRIVRAAPQFSREDAAQAALPGMMKEEAWRG